MACKAGNIYHLALLQKKFSDPQVRMSCTHFTGEEADTWIMSLASAPLCLVFVLALHGPQPVSQPSVKTLFRPLYIFVGGGEVYFDFLVHVARVSDWRVTPEDSSKCPQCCAPVCKLR